MEQTIITFTISLNWAAKLITKFSPYLNYRTIRFLLGFAKSRMYVDGKLKHTYNWIDSIEFLDA